MSSRFLDTRNRLITPKAVRRGLRVNMVCGTLGMMWFAFALGMPLTMFMEKLGARDVAIGLIVTVQWLAMVMQIPSALLAERLTNRKRYWGLTALLHRLLWFLPPLIPAFFSTGDSAGWVMLALVCVSSVLSHASAAPWFSWMADLIPEHQRNRFWARRQSWVQVAFLVAMGLGGWILDHYAKGDAGGSDFNGFRIVFVLAAVLGSLDILLHLTVPEPQPHPVTRASRWYQRLRAPFADSDFLWLTLSFGVWSFSLGLVGSFCFLYLKREFQASYLQLSATTVAAALGTVVASPLWGKVMNHVGERTFVIGLLILAPLFAFQWFFLPTGTVSVCGATVPLAIVLICLVNVVSGAFYTGIPLGQIVMVSEVTKKDGRTLAMAVHWTLVGLLGAGGPALGGVVMDFCAERAFAVTLPTGIAFGGFHILVLAHVLVSWAVAVPLLAKTRPRHGNLSVRALAGNPLRVVGLIHNLVTLGEASCSRVRAKAVRGLGKKRSAHVVGELIEQLNDPNAEVREEAVQALGRIGSPTAVDALLQQLEDPESDLSAHISKALRRTRDPRSVDALMRNLDSPDAEVRKESARSLGAIGDQRAAGTLLELVRESEDMPLVTASSEALASLGQGAAVHQIFRRMRQARNPALRTSLAVAVADLLGSPGEFYPILMRERRESGSEISAMLNAIETRIRRVGGTLLRDDVGKLCALMETIEAVGGENDFSRLPGYLFDLALGLATLRREVNRGPGARAVLENLIWRDPQFGIGFSFLNSLRELSPSSLEQEQQKTESLMGIYFLFHWVKSWRDGSTAGADGEKD